uniref:Trimethylamine-N-oxide reductase n=1 Tax=mine drainage metagenome TaxID=410659 RepID=E6PJX6_9ZZZZ
MHRAIDPLFEARSDYDIFTALADRLGFKQTFTEGRSEMDWLQHFYETAAKSSHAQGFEMPDFKSFWEKGYVEFPEGPADHVMYGDFRKDPDSNPLGTPSGKIEIYSQQIASYRYDDCPPHPAWLEPAESGSAAPKRLNTRFISTRRTQEIGFTRSSTTRGFVHGMRSMSASRCGSTPATLKQERSQMAMSSASTTIAGRFWRVRS